MNFFNEERLSNLLDYLMKDSSDLSDKDLSYKFPNVAAGLFSSGTQKVNDFFSFKKDERLIRFERLFEVLQDKDLNYTRMGYVQKIVDKLIFEKPKIFLKFVYLHPDIMKNLIKHAECKSTATLLLNLLIINQNNLGN